jgi:hypothetical protein
LVLTSAWDRVITVDLDIICEGLVFLEVLLVSIDLYLRGDLRSEHVQLARDMARHQAWYRFT